VGAFAEFKAIWDPGGAMNPHKVVDPYRIDENLRLGTGYRPRDPKTHFAFPDDEGSFADATLRCVGIGKCRRTEGGTMCPSFMVTRDEQHTTRGRAHLLNEMLRGELVRDEWRDEHVRQALDLCLACKGCKADCPVNVDVATYKAEFLAHYYRGRLRPRSAYAMGLIPWTARLARRLPALANLFTQTPGLADIVKRAGGLAPERSLPRFARPSFPKRLAGRRPANPDGPPVILWPDTFTSSFEPHIGDAALRVLEGGGFRVTVPQPWLCCGRPLYDYGMLAVA